MSEPILDFRDRLFALWSEACDYYEGDTQPEHFAEWSGATKDVLRLGMRWDGEREEYTFEPEKAESAVAAAQAEVDALRFLERAARCWMDTAHAHTTDEPKIFEALTRLDALRAEAGRKDSR